MPFSEALYKMVIRAPGNDQSYKNLLNYQYEHSQLFTLSEI